MEMLGTQLRYVLRGVSAPAWLQEFAQSVTKGGVALSSYHFDPSSGRMHVTVAFQPAPAHQHAPIPAPVDLALSFPLVETMNVVPAQILMALPKEFGRYVAACLETSLTPPTVRMV